MQRDLKKVLKKLVRRLECTTNPAKRIGLRARIASLTARLDRKG